MDTEQNSFVRFIKSLSNLVDAPVTFVREKLIVPNQQQYPYYHEKFRRVPTVDQCYVDDYVCKFEAQHQFLRDRAVDSEILSILRQRFEHCVHEDYNARAEEKCESIHRYYEDAAGAWFCKYGDLGPQPYVQHAYMKQKHRMVWERRHGPVGSGMKEDPYKLEDEH